MVCASGLFQPELKQRILSLTLNDTALVANAAIARIRAYAGSPPAFATVLELVLELELELEAFFRQVYKPCKKIKCYYINSKLSIQDVGKVLFLLFFSK